MSKPQYSISVNMFVSDSEKALYFYEKVFGAICMEKNTDAPKGERSARYRIGSGLFAIADENSAWGSRSPLTLGGSPVCIQLFVDDVEQIMQGALKEGAVYMSPSTIETPVLTMPGGIRFGNILDPFGYVWSISKSAED